jgi:hypothetical protein
MAIVKLKRVRVASPVPWDAQSQTTTLVVRRHAGVLNGTLELDSTARLVVATWATGRVALIPMENVSFAEPMTAADEKALAPQPAPEPKPPPKPAVSDVVKFAKDSKGNIVEKP